MSNYALDADETVALQSRRHWINLLPAIVSAFGLLVASALLSYFAGRGPSIGKVAIPRPFFAGASLILLVLGILVFLTGWWVYRRNLLVLTSKHLIKVEQNGLFARKTSQLSLDRVQDVDGSRSGLFGTVLDYGSVEVETAGEQEQFVFIQMPNPSALANELVKAHDQFTDRGGDGLGTRAPVADASAQTQAPIQPPVVPAVGTQVPVFEPPQPAAPVAEPPTSEPPTVPVSPSNPAPIAENQTVQVTPPDSTEG